MKRLRAKLLKLIRNKIRSSSKGFSIIEMLVAVVILLMATSLVASAMKLASERYLESTNRSKAQMILSTLSDFVRSELTTGSDFVLSDGGDVSFIDGSGILGGRCVLKNEQNTICLKNKDDTYFPIVGSKGDSAFDYANELKVRFDLSPSKEKERIKFGYEIKVEDKTGKELASGKYEVSVKASDMDE